MDLSHLVNDATNCVEVFLLPKAADVGSGTLPVGTAMPPVLHAGTPTRQRIVEYTHRHLTYAFDTSNDAQRLYARHFQKDWRDAGIYAVAFDEETMPNHRFPCVDEVTQRTEIMRDTYRVNNRMSIIHDASSDGFHYVYIRYNHSPRMDMTKMNADLQKAMRILRRKS